MKMRMGLVLVLIVAGAAILRGCYLHERMQEPDADSPLLDSAYHHYWAAALASGNWAVPEGYADPQIRTTPFFRPPGYPYFLAAVYRAFGARPLAAFAVQMTLGLANILLAFLLARRWIGLRAALLFAGCMGVSWIFIYFEAELLAPAPILTLTILGIWLLSRLIDTGSPGRAMTAAVPAGLLALFLPNALVFIPAAALWIFALELRRAAGRQGLIEAAAFLSVCALFILPCAVRNARTDGSWTLISANGGINLYLGNNAAANGIDPAAPDVWGWSCFDYPDVVRRLEAREGRELNYAEASRCFARKACAFIRANPGRALRLTLKKALLFWGPLEVGNEKEIEAVRERSRLLGRLPFPFALVLALGALGMALYARELKDLPPDEAGRKRHFLGLSLVFILVLFASYLPFFAADRYRVPILPLLLLFGALAVERTALWMTQGRAGQAARWWAAGCILWLLVGRNYGGYEPRLHKWHLERGIALAGAGRLAEAAVEFNTTVRLFPGEVMGHFNLAEIMAMQDRLPEAIRNYTQALQLNPDFTDARLGLGKALACSGDINRGAVQFQRVLDAEPLNEDALCCMASVWQSRGDLKKACAHFEKAVAVNPGNLDARLTLGFCLLELGEPARAREQFEAVSKMSPGHPAAEQGLRASERKLRPASNGPEK